MKIWLVLVLLLLIGPVHGATYQLGSHNVSINLDIPANYTQELPTYLKDIGTWGYMLNVTPKSGGYILIYLSDNAVPVYGSKIIDEAGNALVNNSIQAGIGGLKYGTRTYQGHDAFEISAPAQRIAANGGYWNWPEFFSLIYLQDEMTFVRITAINTGESIFRKVLNSTTITKISQR